MRLMSRAILRLGILGLALGSALALAACGWAGNVERPAVTVAGGDAELGRSAFATYGCISCHTIPGVDRADAHVGPPLTEWAKRGYIAGRLPNEPDNLIRWLRYPQEVDPGNAMPDLDVTESDARNMATYLYELD